MYLVHHILHQIIQKIIEEIAKPLGFTDEKEGLFKKYSNSGLRPDFYKKLGKTGILMEVERGKTTTNNMDLLDRISNTHVEGLSEYVIFDSCQEVIKISMSMPCLVINQRLMPS